MILSDLSKGKKTLSGIVISITLVIVLGITNIVPYFAVIPDMVKVGIDYLSLGTNPDFPDKNELEDELLKAEEKTSHPFILADITDFEKVAEEYKSKKAHLLHPKTDRLCSF